MYAIRSYYVPYVAMVRLPTAESDGKANLHKGGVGVGLDLVTGRTMHGMQKGKTTDIHPDTANPLGNLSVPHWDEMLLMAAKAYDVTVITSYSIHYTKLYESRKTVYKYGYLFFMSLGLL